MKRMKRIVATVFTATFTLMSLHGTTTSPEESFGSEQSDDEIFAVVESMPEFPGGMQTLMTWLQNNINYPSICIEKGVQGSVITRFVVDIDGSITDPVVVYSADPYLDREALRVVKSMPKWTPGVQEGKKVRVVYTLPVQFRLNGVNEATIESDGNVYKIISTNGNLTLELKTMQVSGSSVSIPEKFDNLSVTSIGSEAFKDCSNLTSVNIPSSVTNIGARAFYGCSNLTSISVDEGNPVYDSRDNCNAIIKTGTNTLVVGCKTTVIPNSVTSIGNYAFYGCESIYSIAIPESVTNIGNYAFGGTGLTSLIIPNSITNIGIGAFVCCSQLNSITIPEGLANVGDYAFTKTGWWNNQSDGFVYLDNLLLGYKGHLPTDDMGIKEGTEIITDGAFEFCNSLASVIIPNSVTKIGSNAFEGCSYLASVHINDLDTWCKVDFVNNTSNPLFYAQELYLNGECVKELVIPSSVASIKDYAFCGYSGLTCLTIPNSVTNIGSSAFYGCENLKNIINFSDLNLLIGSQEYGHVAYYADKVINADNHVGDFYFKTNEHINSLIGYMGTHREIILPENYKGENYTIGKRVFYKNDSLTSVTIPNSVENIEAEAFYACRNLTKLVIGSSVSNIQRRAFCGCKALTDVVSYAITPPTMGDNIFKYIDTETCTLKVPIGSKSAYQAADQWKDFYTIEEFASSIDKILLDETTTADIYTIDGSLYMKDADVKEVKLPRGLYIIGGKKVMVK